MFHKKPGATCGFHRRSRDALMVEVADRSTETVTTRLTALSGCTDRLAENDQRMLKLCYVEDIPIRQIADAMGRSPKASKTLCAVSVIGYSTVFTVK